jgi:hypothetical protein
MGAPRFVTVRDARRAVELRSNVLRTRQLTLATLTGFEPGKFTREEKGFDPEVTKR